MTVRPVLVAVVALCCLLAVLPLCAIAGEDGQPRFDQSGDHSSPPHSSPPSQQQPEGDRDRDHYGSQPHIPSHPERPEHSEPPCAPSRPPPPSGDWSWLRQAERELAAALSLTERQQESLKRQTARLDNIVRELRTVERELEEIVLAGERIAKELEHTKVHPACKELEKRLLAALRAAALLVAQLDGLLEKADCAVTSLLRLLADQRCRIAGQLQAIEAAGRLIERAREEQSRGRCSRPRESSLRKEIEAALARIHKTSAEIAAAEDEIEAALRLLEELLKQIQRILCELRLAAAAVLKALEKFKRCQKEGRCEPEKPSEPCEKQQPQPPCDQPEHRPQEPCDDKREQQPPCEEERKPHEPCEQDKQPQQPCEEAPRRPEKPCKEEDEHRQPKQPCDEGKPHPEKPCKDEEYRGGEGQQSSDPRGQQPDHHQP